MGGIGTGIEKGEIPEKREVPYVSRRRDGQPSEADMAIWRHVTAPRDDDTMAGRRRKRHDQ